jgi:CubicO group peptidase (beta-lactamase class C family)
VGDRAKMVLDPLDPVTEYVDADELRDEQGNISAYACSMVHELLDMRSAIKFSEAYSEEDSEVREMEAAAGWGPPHRDHADDSIKAFLSRREKIEGQGHDDNGPFEYRSCESAMLGWICEEAYNKYGKTRDKPKKTYAELVSDLLWKQIGAEKSAYITVDREGTGAFDGGICATLRDLARFGAMICRNGMSLPTSNAPSGQRVGAAKWVEDVFAARDTEAAFRRSPKYDQMRMPDGKYRSMFWAPTINREVVLCIGVYGQMVYINRATRTVGVKLSSANQAVALDDLGGTWGNGYPAFLMFDKISTHLGPVPRTPAAVINP